MRSLTEAPRRHHHGSRPWILSLLVLTVGCAGQESAENPGSAANPSIAETTEAFSGNWNYSWGDTQYSETGSLGSSLDRTCFLSGLAGNIQSGVSPAACTQAGAGLTVDAQNQYHLYVQPACGDELNVFARCVNSTAGRTTEKTWFSQDPAVDLGPVTSKKRCFLTSIVTSGAYHTSLGLASGLNSDSDWVRTWSDGERWWLGGHQSGVLWASAQCIDVSEDDGSWEWIAGRPGSRQDPLTNIGGATCLLTGVGGRFGWNDWVDGAYISFDSGSNQFFMNTKNGKTGWATCVK